MMVAGVITWRSSQKGDSQDAVECGLLWALFPYVHFPKIIRFPHENANSMRTESSLVSTISS